MIKILHTSDFHFGYSSYLPVNDSHRLITLDKVLSIAKDHDLLLICGDLFSTCQTAQSIREQIFSQLFALADAGTPIVITPAPHEVRQFDGLMHDNISVCRAPLEIFNQGSDEHRMTVYTGHLLSSEMLASVERTTDDGFHIGAFHTDLLLQPFDGNETVKSDLSGFTLDFYALGGFHNFKVFRSGGSAFAAYSGSPETVYPGENRERYVLSYEAAEGSVERMKRLAVNTLMYDRQFIDTAEYGSASEIYSMVEKYAGPNTILEVDLKGEELFTDKDMLKKLSSRFKLLLIHQEYTSGVMELAKEYLAEDSVRGDFFRALSAYTGETETEGEYDPEYLLALLDALNTKEILTREALCELFSV